MYKLMLVDDEPLILNAIADVVDWGHHHAELVATALNGEEAYELFLKHQPDIVITDIRMPGLDGLGLIRKILSISPMTKFIILSGFEEFEYAKRAMHKGVKQYLLKPCDETQITEALDEVIRELEAQTRRDDYLNQLRNRLELVIPQVKEQWLKEFITNKTYGKREWEICKDILSLSDEPYRVQLLLFQLDSGDYEFEHLFALYNIAKECFEKEAATVYLNTSLGDQVILVISEMNDQPLFAVLRNIQGVMLNYYKMEVTVSISSVGSMESARDLYKEASKYMEQKFYYGTGSLLSCRTVGALTEETHSFKFHFDELRLLVRNGDAAETMQWLDHFFHMLSSNKYDRHQASAYVVELWLQLVREEKRETDDLYRKLPQLFNLTVLDEMAKTVKDTAISIMQGVADEHEQREHRIVKQIKGFVQDHLSLPDLSLGWLSQQKLFLTADYLGKIFRNETGEKFSDYVNRLRIEKAMEMINDGEDLKIFELAEAVGFRDNAQYFSQVFKKMTGATPSEYKNKDS